MEENDFVEDLVLMEMMPFEADADCAMPPGIDLLCSGLWLGAESSSNASQDWTWVTGEEWGGFTDWAPQEPFGNGDRLRLDRVVIMGQAELRWNDAPSGASGATGYIIENND